MLLGTYRRAGPLLFLTFNLQGRYLLSHFTDEGTKAQTGKTFAQIHTATKWFSRQ